MDIIPYVRLIFGIIAFGFMYYIYGNVYDMLVEIPHFAEAAAGTTYMTMFVIWMALPFIYVIYASITLLMSVQKRSGIP